VLSGVIIAEEADGVGDSWSGNTTTVDLQTFLGAFFKLVPELCLFH
jgi:hypothetical protein